MDDTVLRPSPPSGLTCTELETADGPQLMIARRNWIWRPTLIVVHHDRIEARGRTVWLSHVLAFEVRDFEVLVLEDWQLRVRRTLFRGRTSHARWICDVLDQAARARGAPMQPPPGFPTARARRKR